MACYIHIEVIYVQYEKKNLLFYSDKSKEVVQEGQGGMNISELEPREGKDAAPSPGKELHNRPRALQLVNHAVSHASPGAQLRYLSLGLKCSVLLIL